MGARKNQPEQTQAPVVQRIRIRYAKRGPLRFTSHRDFARAFERAVRRAGVPVAYSQGFSPHPKISYASAAPTGVASEAEYLEIGLQAAAEPERVRAALDEALSPGLDKQWLWQDWQDSLREYEQDDCRWTPCFDCGVCSNLGTDIQVGPTGRSLLPLVPR